MSMLTAGSDSVVCFPYRGYADSWSPLVARLVGPGAVDGDRGARDLVGRGVARAEEIVSPALGVEGAHAHAVDLGASVVSGLGIAAQEEGAGEDE